jgi:CheY-like chemotaxis protein
MPPLVNFPHSFREPVRQPAMKRLNEGHKAKPTGPIIVVDDVNALLEVVSLFLREFGYGNVLLFDCPKQALSRVREGLRPSLVITDHDMPEMNGLEMLKSIRLICPGTPAVIMTGDYALLKRDDLGCPVIIKGTMDFATNLRCHVEKSLRGA